MKLAKLQLQSVLLTYLLFLPWISSRNHHDDDPVRPEVDYNPSTNLKLANRADIDDPSLVRGRKREVTVPPPEFSYDGKDEFGPSNWYKIAPGCGGMYQSPIMLNTSSALYVRKKRPLQITGLNNIPLSIKVKNTGYKVDFTCFWRCKQRPYIQGGPLKLKYYFEQFHFHWGSNDSVGSDHILDSHSYPIELHLVFYNSLYSSFQEAQTEVDGLAVVGRFYEIRKGGPLNPWTRFLKEVIEAGSEFIIPARSTFPLSDLMDDVEWPYFSYEGSLTSPPCVETVTWMVSTKTLLMTSAEMEKFRKLQFKNGAPMNNNHRPVQPQYCRRVFRY